MHQCQSSSKQALYKTIGMLLQRPSATGRRAEDEPCGEAHKTKSTHHNHVIQPWKERHTTVNNHPTPTQPPDPRNQGKVKATKVENGMPNNNSNQSHPEACKQAMEFLTFGHHRLVVYCCYAPTLLIHHGGGHWGDYLAAVKLIILQGSL